MKGSACVIGIVTARGGSKGVPGKNLRLLAGQPLIAHTIRAAKAATTLGRVVVSTDDAEIARVAQAYGAEVPFLRPAELAQDVTPTLPVLQHAVRVLEQAGGRCDVIVTLQPTAPLRLARDIDEAVRLLEAANADAVVSVREVSEHPSRMRRIQDGRLVTLDGTSRFLLNRRQDFEPVYIENGAIYVTRRRVLMEEGAILGKETRALIMPQSRSLDIDTERDFDRAEESLRASALVEGVA